MGHSQGYFLEAYWLPGPPARERETNTSWMSSQRALCFFRSMIAAVLRPLASVMNRMPFMENLRLEFYSGVGLFRRRSKTPTQGRCASLNGAPSRLFRGSG